MDWKEKAIVLKQVGYSGRNIAKILGLGKSTVNNFFQKTEKEKYTVPEGVKILLLDVETAPLSGAIWSIWQQLLCRLPFCLSVLKKMVQNAG